MMYYSEFGYGNESIFSVEVEDIGSEYRMKGVVIKKVVSIYVRVWVGNKTLILDSKEGIKVGYKSKRCVKVLFGIKSN